MPKRPKVTFSIFSSFFFSLFSSFSFSFSFSFLSFSSCSSFFCFTKRFLINFWVFQCFLILFCNFFTISLFLSSLSAIFFNSFIALIWSSLFNCFIVFVALLILSFSSFSFSSLFSNCWLSLLFKRSSNIPLIIKLNSSLSNFFLLFFLSSSISFTASINSSSLLKTEILSIGSKSDLL